MIHNDQGTAYLYFVLIVILALVGCTSQNGPTYLVKQINQSDGKVGPLNTVDWSQANLLNDLISPWREAPSNTTFQALWDDQYFYFKFAVLEDNILIYRDQDLEEEVVGSERVEIFFRQDEELNPYYCLEMDASGRVYDYKAAHYREFVREWSWPRDQLMVEASQSEDGYTVAGKISLVSLKELGLLKENKLQAGLFRGRCLQAGGDDSSFHWISWVHPETDQPDFHVASSFGELVLVE
jgi:hypothetical protein